MPDESIKPPGATKCSLVPALNHTNNKSHVKSDGIYLK